MPSKKAIPCSHWDEQRIKTDNFYRFQYLSEFGGFGQEDIDAIHAAAPVVAPLVPAIVDAVYVKLFSFDTTKSVFLQRNCGFTGKLPTNLEDLDLENDQIKFRKDFLGKYLKKLVTADYDQNFVKYLDYVGKIHTAYSGKASRVNVEYVHCSALFIFVSSFIIDALVASNQPKRTIVAFNKLLWIQNDYFAKWYVRDDNAPKCPISKTERFVKSQGPWIAVASAATFLATKFWLNH